MAQAQGPLVQQQSAQELISAALAKIRKNANARKHGALIAQAKELEEKLPEVGGCARPMHVCKTHWNT